MSRVSAYLEGGNDLGQHVSAGGQRGNAASVWARLNTDNASKSDCALRVSADVVGDLRANGGKLRKTCRGCGRRWAVEKGEYREWDAGERVCPDCGIERQGIDTRKTIFSVGLPEQEDDNCEVRIDFGSPKLRELVNIGAMLCAVKGASQIAQGQEQAGIRTIEGARSILREMAEEDRERRGPNITLPGGVPLAHALRCVQIVKQLCGPLDDSN